MEQPPNTSQMGTIPLSPAPAYLMGTPAAFRSDVADLTHTQSQMDADLCHMLQALSTQMDIEALILCIEEAHSRDIEVVRTDLHDVTDRGQLGRRWWLR